MLLWGAVVEGDFGAVVEFAGDDVEAGLAADDGGFGQVVAYEPLDTFTGSPSPESCWGEPRTRPLPCRK